jgi:hypothetical protein
MKKTITFITGALLMGLLLFSTSCKKSVSMPSVTNEVSVKLNGTQQTIDSLVIKTRMVNSKIVSIDMFSYLNHGTGGSCAISLLITPSNPKYAAGTTLSLANGDAEVFYMTDGGTEYDDNPYVFPSVGANPASTIIITKNDVTARRIEGTLTGCILPRVQGSGSASVTIDGSFAVNY